MADGGRRSRVVLTPQWQVSLELRGARCGDGDKQAKSRRGEHEVSRSPSRRESRVVSGYTCGPTSRAFHCSGPMGAIGARLSLRPLIEEGETKSKARTKSCRENAKLCPHPHGIARWSRAMTPLMCFAIEANPSIRHDGTAHAPHSKVIRRAAVGSLNSLLFSAQ